MCCCDTIRVHKLYHTNKINTHLNITITRICIDIIQKYLLFHQKNNFFFYLVRR